MRSQFLTLLCALTFLSCALGIFDATVSLLKADDVSETIRIDRKLPPDDQKAAPKQYYEDRSTGNAPIPEDPEIVSRLAIGQLIYSVLTLIGAVLMFRLLRVGFWIYIAGVVVGTVLPVVLVGFGALNVSFGVFFSVLFAILYSQTMKEMR